MQDAKVEARIRRKFRLVAVSNLNRNWQERFPRGKPQRES
jgi:hypothetical protein